jgi:hypothetical protein
MSRSAASARRSRRKGNPVALFPFLAVLVCTMGALIVVLVVLARQSRIQAGQATVAQAAEAKSDLEAAQEISEWRLSEMASANQKAQAKLAETRLQLGHLEDHARQLRRRLDELEAQWQEIQRLKSKTGQGRDDLAAERARLNQRIAEAERELAEAQKASQEGPKSYAVVPYVGPNGTRRRPLYIECRSDAIVLQPEGIVFRESDFPDPIGPGNPLDTAVRAARESLLAQNAIKGDGSDEPYPLLLVRPGGIVAYYVARQALKSWKGETGYELIGEDWKLAFPQPDAALARAVGEAVELAREGQRQRALLAAMASASRPRTTYRAAPRGGLIREGGPEEDDSDAQGGRPAAGFGFGSGSASSPGEGPESRGSGQSPASGGSKPRLGAVSESANSQPGAKTGRPLRPGEWIPAEDQRDKKPPRSEKSSPKNKSLAEGRGRNWGLPDAARGSVPITRSIRVDCFPDQLVVLPDGAGRSKAVVLGERTEESADSLVSAVWEQMKAWGIAGRGMYWQPVLKVRVAPGAETRYIELKVLLKDSGLEVERAGG